MKCFLMLKKNDLDENYSASTDLRVKDCVVLIDGSVLLKVIERRYHGPVNGERAIVEWHEDDGVHRANIACSLLRKVTPFQKIPSDSQS